MSEQEVVAGYRAVIGSLVSADVAGITIISCTVHADHPTTTDVVVVVVVLVVGG